MKSGTDEPDWDNLHNLPAEFLAVDSKRKVLDDFRKFAKPSKTKPRTNPGVRDKN